MGTGDEPSLAGWADPQVSPDVFEGLWRPCYCPRGKDDCESMSQIIAAGHTSFICCGEHGKGKIPQDKYRLCFKNQEIDDMQDYDKRDIIQTATVLMGAAAIIEEHDSGKYHNPLESKPTAQPDEAEGE